MKTSEKPVVFDRTAGFSDYGGGGGERGRDNKKSAYVHIRIYTCLRFWREFCLTKEFVCAKITKNDKGVAICFVMSFLLKGRELTLDREGIGLCREIRYSKNTGASL